MNDREIGVFGGTFDPIHVGHLFVANAVFAEAGLARVLFLPVGDPAHRRTHAPATDRKEMVRLAISDNQNFALDETALGQPAPVYTVDTMPLLKAAHPNAKLSFIAGADSLVDSPWRRLDEVASALHRFYVVSREGTDSGRLSTTFSTLPAQLAQRFVILNLPLIDISSTGIRNRVAFGKPIRYLVPDPVAAYIERTGLYRAHNGRQ